MKTDWAGRVGCVTLIAFVAAYAWFSRHPDSPLLDRAADWPGVGTLVEKFRARYRSSDPELDDSVEPPPIEIVVERIEPEHTALPKLWLRPGTELHERPEESSEVVGRVHALANFGYTEQRGRWYRVRRPSRGGSVVVEGWVLVEDVEAARPTLEAEPEPTRPLPANEIDGERLAEARQLMGEPREGECGGYALTADVESASLDRLCATTVAAVDAAYARRYGLQPLGTPAETVLVFGTALDFRIFASRTSRWQVESTGRASAAGGYVALAWDEAQSEARGATLVHELVHLVNRRALGPALPAWLDEGIADDLADRMVGGKYDAAAWQVGMDRAAGELLPLADFVALGSQEFYEGRGFSNYAQGLLLVRFLAEDERLAPHFQEFLADVAAGSRGDAASLVTRLGVPLSELDRRWQAWIAGGR